MTNNPQDGERTVLVKRSIEKDGLPKKDGIYLVENSVNSDFIELRNGVFMSKTMKPSHYYEELPLSQLIQEVMPTEEEWRDKIIELSASAKERLTREPLQIKDITVESIVIFFEWLKTKFTK